MRLLFGALERPCWAVSMRPATNWVSGPNWPVRRRQPLGVYPQSPGRAGDGLKWDFYIILVYNGLMSFLSSGTTVAIDRTIRDQPKLVPTAKPKNNNYMKTLRYLMLTAVTAVVLCSPRAVLAQTTTTTPPPTPPVVVPNDDKDLHRDLRGAPAAIKDLILGFDLTRDSYLKVQADLLAKLKAATTPEEREKIREQLQDNRQAFLDSLKAFRLTLKDDLTALKGKISHEEFLRIVDAAHDAATEGGPFHHKP